MADAKNDELTAIIPADPWAMEILRLARNLALPDWVIGAGFIRGLVWDRLCGFTRRSPLNDIDVVYFDPADISRGPEHRAEAALSAQMPGENWAVRNMARMHIKNGEPPYTDLADALAHWLETPTAVGIRLEEDDRLTVIAPHGVTDLLAGRVLPTPSGRRKLDEYRRRVTAKDWPSRWPRVIVEGLI